MTLMKELLDLLMALRRLTKAATEYLESLTPVSGDIQPIPMAGDAQPAKRGRKKKDEASVPAAVNGTEETTPEESMKQALEVAKAFVQRFQKATPDGLTRAKEILAKRFNVAKIGDLVHAQRVELLKAL